MYYVVTNAYVITTHTHFTKHDHKFYVAAEQTLLNEVIWERNNYYYLICQRTNRINQLNNP